MIPGLLAKSWYVTMCSINLSVLTAKTTLTPLGKTSLFLHVLAHIADIEQQQQFYSPLTFSDLGGVSHLTAEGHADIHVVGGGI